MGGIVAIVLALLAAAVFLMKRLAGERAIDDYEIGAAWLVIFMGSFFAQIAIFAWLGIYGEMAREDHRGSGWGTLTLLLQLWVSFRFAAWVVPSKD